MIQTSNKKKRRRRRTLVNLLKLRKKSRGNKKMRMSWRLCLLS
jgi:hypothetical protein